MRRRRTGTRKPLEECKGRTVACSACGKPVWKPDAWLRRVKQPMCSSKCNGTARGAEWGKHGHKGRAAWGPEAQASASAKMSGAGNPAWKGGVTYIQKKGNYAAIKYVRCPAAFLPMARKDGYVMEHRLIVATILGRCLLRAEVVHHEDHKPGNNAPENLSLFASNRDHKLYEARGTPEPLWRGSSPCSTPGSCGASVSAPGLS